MDSNLAHEFQGDSAPAQSADKQTFADLGLPPDLCDLVKSLGYETPTPIQIQAIPPLIAGRDIIGQAQTGTGKTAAFALPLLSKIDFGLAEPQVLVLTPTRELAIQVAAAFKSYAGRSETFHVLPIYGGQSIEIQLRQLKRRPQVVVGTPGRIMDHLRRGTLNLSSLRALVIDEADEMLSMGFLEDMEWIITHTPAEKQTALFSATMPKQIRRIAQKQMRSPEEIIIRQVASEAALIRQSYWFVNGPHKADALIRILEMNEFDAVLIFVRTKLATVELVETLEGRGYAASELNGDMSQEARERTIDRLKNGPIDIVVATDVAARGLDVERISHVINYDIPFDSEVYTHRIGRTGRAGRSGEAISFVSSREMGLFRSIERGAGKKLQKFPMPTREDVNKRRTAQFKEKVAAEFLKSKYSEFVDLIEEMAVENETSEKNIAAVLCSFLHKKNAASRDPQSAEPKFKTQTSHSRHPGKNGKKEFKNSSGLSKKNEKNRKWNERVIEKGPGRRKKRGR